MRSCLVTQGHLCKSRGPSVSPTCTGELKKIDKKECCMYVKKVDEDDSEGDDEDDVSNVPTFNYWIILDTHVCCLALGKMF